METSTWTYFIILGLSLLYPLAQSFEKRVYMYRKFRFIIPGILLSAVPFIIWDVYFTRHGIWGFNPNFIRGIFILDLPVEEWLFFIVVPYCVFFLHEVLRYFVKGFYFPVFSKYFIIVLTAILVLSLPFIYRLTYTVTAVAYLIPVLLLQLWTKSYRTWFSRFLLTYVVSFIPFLVVNGFLTRIPVVWYNNAENLALRITTIPVEDFIYLMGMLLPAFSVYQWLLKRFASAEEEREKMKDESKKIKVRR